MDLLKQLQGLVDQTLGLFGEHVLPGYYQPGEKFIHLIQLCQNYKSKEILLICKYKMKFVFIVYCIRLFVSRVITMLLPAEIISVTLLYTPYFYFEPSIF